MQLILNIGLNTSENYGKPSVKLKAGGCVEAALLIFSTAKIRYNVLSAKIRRGESEDTLILILSGGFADVYLGGAIAKIATALKQECIAYRVRDSKGAILTEGLAGQYASLWGDFNSDYFFE